MAKYYTVTVNFAGFIGCDETYEVYADDEEDAKNQALELAQADLYCEIEEDEEEDEDE